MGLHLRQVIALVLVMLAVGLGSCGSDRTRPVTLLEGDERTPAINPILGEIAEVSPPERIQQLKPYLDVYQPQVRIAAPRENETLETTTVTVDLQVRDFSLFKNEALGLGPHLHLMLDDQPYQEIYDTSRPTVLSDLTPGTHTLRVLATRPWGESFKNEGAYDQVTFNIFTASANNLPDNSQALLTFNEPQGSYGAEPILLDFYLKNAPLRLVAETSATIPEWQIRCTINGESFVFDHWQPLYLKGFKPGNNWVKLELIDETGSPIENAYNTAIRVIEYMPDGTSSLAKLIRGELPLASAKALVDPNYIPPAPPVIPEVTASEPETQPSPEIVPEVQELLAPTTEGVAAPSIEMTPKLPEVVVPEPGSESVSKPEPPAAIAPALPTPESQESPKPRRLRGRFRRPAEPDSVTPALPIPQLEEETESLTDTTEGVPVPKVSAEKPEASGQQPIPRVEAVPETFIPTEDTPESPPSPIDRLRPELGRVKLPETIPPLPLPENLQEPLATEDEAEQSFADQQKTEIERSLQWQLNSDLPSPKEIPEESEPEENRASGMKNTQPDLDSSVPNSSANEVPENTSGDQEADTTLEALREEAEVI
jgi:hypothetical protein